MPEYVLSGKADQDLTEIYIFSHEQFGEARADAYLLSLEERFSILAGQPDGTGIKLLTAVFLHRGGKNDQQHHDWQSEEREQDRHGPRKPSRSAFASVASAAATETQ